MIERQVVQAIAKYGNSYKHTRLEDASLGLCICHHYADITIIFIASLTPQITFAAC